MADAARDTVNDLAGNDSVQRVKDKGAELAGAAADVGREYADMAREKGQEYAGRAREEASRLYEQGHRKAGEVADYAGERYDEVSEMVRRRPAQALGIAAGVGFLIGLVLASRR